MVPLLRLDSVSVALIASSSPTGLGPRALNAGDPWVNHTVLEASVSEARRTRHAEAPMSPASRVTGRERKL